MKVLLLKEDAEKLANYLASRPWGEVNGLLALFAKAEMVEEESDKAKEEVKEEAKG